MEGPVPKSLGDTKRWSLGRLLAAMVGRKSIRKTPWSFINSEILSEQERPQDHPRLGPEEPPWQCSSSPFHSVRRIPLRHQWRKVVFSFSFYLHSLTQSPQALPWTWPMGIGQGQPGSGVCNLAGPAQMALHLWCYLDKCTSRGKLFLEGPISKRHCQCFCTFHRSEDVIVLG